MKITHIILLSFFVILVLFTVTTYINYRQAELVNENSENFARSSILIRHSNRFQRNFLNMVSGLRGYLLTNEGFFIQTYDSAIHENEEILSDLAALVSQDLQQKEVLQDIQKLNSHWVNQFALPLLNAKRSTGVSDSSRRAFNQLYKAKVIEGAEKDVQINLQKKFQQFSNYEYGFRDTQKDKLTAAVQNTKSISFTLTAISIVAGMCIAMFIAYYISSKIVKMVQLARSISEGNYEAHVDGESNTELGQLAKALNQMATVLNSHISILKRQRDELDQFAHIVSHDLKAPLRGIDNVVTWIEEDHSFALPPKVNEYLDLIKGRIIRAENLLKGILTYARVSKEETFQEVVDLNELLVEIQEYVPKRPGIELIIAPGFPVLFTQRVLLIQIFTNLITNAFKYHDKEAGYIKVYHKDAGNYFEFYIEDNGPGIEKIYHDKIFVIFQTLQERDSFESTGVGLSIVKKILDDRGYKIKLLSEKGRGSIFCFTWPKTELYEQVN
jgi:signal transduction histidine kinase